VVACRDDLILECPQEQAEEVTRFLERIMVSGMDEVLNPVLDADRPERVPILVDVEILQSWGER
jgi:DNA polymerase I-like protein with 3'-5' exonuclease and polymerase domains